MNYFKLFLIFFLAVNFSNAQENNTKKVYGKIVADYKDLEGIYIVNLKTEQSTTTQNGGYFSIHASVGDTLLFSAVQFKGLKMAITNEDLQKETLLVKLQPMIRHLDEVKIMNYDYINAVSLGIISANTKHFTPAERKLNAASNTYFKGNTDGTTGASIGIDPLINLISGRTAMLEKQVIVEKKEALIAKINYTFSERFVLEKLNIPEEYLKGFDYYLVEDNEFVAAMNTKNKKMATFIMGGLAEKYLHLIR